jgi:tight adherence protein B
MLLIFILAFVAIFAVIAPILFFLGGGASADRKKKTIAALDSAIGETSKEKSKPLTDFRRDEAVSAIPWFGRVLLQLDLGPRLQKMLNQANLKWTPGALVLLTIGCFVLPAYLVFLRVQSVIPSVLLGIASGFIPLGYVMFKRGQRLGKFEAGLPDALELMVGALRVGHSFNAAMGMVTRECPDPVSTEFRITFDQQNFGLDLRAALEGMQDRVPLQDLKIAVTAILIQRESGGNLAEVLEKTAYVIRQRFRLRRQVMVHTAQGRMTGWVLSILPAALGVGLYFVNPEMMSLLWTRPIGVKLLYGAGASLTIGSIIIQKIVRMEV